MLLALIAVIVVAFCNLVLGLIVLLKNRGSLTNVSFGIFAFLLSAWIVINFYSNDAALSHGAQLWLNRATISIPVFALYFLLLFSLQFTRFGNRRFRSFAILFGVFSLIFGAASATPLLISGVTPKGNIIVANFGPFIAYFSVFIICLFLAIIIILLGSLRRLDGAAKARTQIMAASLFAALAITVITNLIMPVIFHQFNYTVIGILSTIIIVGGFTYAIVRHRLFDIRAVIARSMAYLLLLVTLGTAYALITFRIGGLIFSSGKIQTAQQSFNIITALILTLTFQPLKLYFEKITDKIFFHGHYDAQVVTNQISHILATEVRLVELSRRVRNILAHSMRISEVNIVVLNNGQVFTEGGHYVVSRLEDLARDLEQLRGKVVVTDEEPEGKRKEVLQRYDISVMAALRTREDKKIGYLLFGPKLNGDIYGSTDLSVISTIADQLAVAIQNAKAYVQIQQFNHTLERKIKDATKQLREANHSLQELDQVKDDFISMASHQLRTPLTVIDGYLSNILDGMYGTTNQQQKQAIGVARNRLSLTRSLVADLLNMSRIEAGRFFIDARPIDLDTVVAEEVEQLQIRAEEQGIHMVYQIPTKPIPTLSLDESKTRQAIINLIDNALNYSPEGHVTVSLEHIGDQVIFQVVDDGMGVPDHERDKVFSKFFRADNAKNARADGTGIGLYLVKRVIEEQGGSVIFLSQEGKGSTFGFRLPVRTNVKAASKPTRREPELAATASS